MATRMSEPLDPEDETFWKQVREGYNQVRLKPELLVEIEVGNRKATIHTAQKIFVVIEDIPAKPVKLIAE